VTSRAVLHEEEDAGIRAEKWPACQPCLYLLRIRYLRRAAMPGGHIRYLHVASILWLRQAYDMLTLNACHFNLPYSA